jgi:uncharacterized protein involved in exopolysaccharide biosynthesis
LLKHRGIIAVCSLAGGAILGLASLQTHRMFLSFTTFTVRGSRTVQATGIAARLGLTPPSTGEIQTPQFYGELVTSRAILRPVAEKTYTVSTPTGQVQRPLAYFLGIDDKNPNVATTRALDVLTSRVSILEIGRTGVITAIARAEDPQIAQQILQNVLTEVDSYNLAQRRKQAAAERDFIERRLAEAGAALASAEQQLSGFLQTNRQYGSSPVLQLEHDRLQRVVRMRQQIYTGMAQSLEQAKIEEVRDLPTIAVIDPPEVPLKPERPLAIRRTFLGLIAGLLVGIILAFFRERSIELRAAKTRAYTEYTALKAEAVGGLIKLTPS